MILERKRYRRATLSALAVASFICAQTAYAAGPTGCTVGGLPTNYFTDLQNVNSGSGTSSGTSLASAETATAQVLEIVAQRRSKAAEKEQICPIGSALVGGICQPVRQNLSRTDKQEKKKPKATLTKPSAPYPSVEEVGFQEPNFEAWGEGFIDYERRTGLMSGNANETRSQTTAGALFGADRHFYREGFDIAFGVLGGASETRQSFTSSVSQMLDTTYTHTQPLIGAPGTATYTYLFPTEHQITADANQNIKSPIIGLTFSVSRGGFFIDGVLRAELGDLNRTTQQSDAFAQTLNAVFQNETFGQPPGSNQAGCITINPRPGDPIYPNGYTLTNVQAVQASLAQQTTATQLIYAQNAGYHFDLSDGFWVEPLVGGQFTYAFYGSNAAALGLQDGYALRVQGGARVGKTDFGPGGYVWTTSFTGLLYSDVLIHGFVTNADGFSAGFLQADQNQLRVQGILSCKVDLRNGLSAFAEAQGRYGTNYYGVGGRIGTRYQW